MKQKKGGSQGLGISFHVLFSVFGSPVNYSWALTGIPAKVNQNRSFLLFFFFIPYTRARSDRDYPTT